MPSFPWLLIGLTTKKRATMYTTRRLDIHTIYASRKYVRHSRDTPGEPQEKIKFRHAFNRKLAKIHEPLHNQKRQGKRRRPNTQEQAKDPSPAPLSGRQPSGFQTSSPAGRVFLERTARITHPDRHRLQNEAASLLA